jgi:preprotein translocase subunit SecG
VAPKRHGGSSPPFRTKNSGAPKKVENRVIYLVTAIHIIVCILLIVIILLQQGKSADLAAAFGGQGSQTAFGPRSAANLLTKSTTWLAVVFVLTSITLTVMMQHQTAHHTTVLSGSTTSQPAKK